MAPSNVFASDIQNKQKNVRVMMRVVRKWLVQEPGNQKNNYTVQLVLMDSKADRIACTIRRQLVYKFKELLQENEVYVLTKLGVDTVDGDYRASSHKYKLTFDYETEVIKQSQSKLPQISYNFTNPSDVFSTNFDCKYLIDIIGVLTGLGQEKGFVKNGKKSQLMTIDLHNAGFAFNVTLFGNLVEELKSYISQSAPSNVVVVLLFAKVKHWQGSNNISSTFSSKLLINPDIAEAVAFKTELGESFETPTKALTQLPDKSKLSLIDDFINCTPRSTIRGVKEFFRKGKSTATTQDLEFVVLANIYEFVEEAKWFYIACKICTRSATSDSGLYYCGHCNKHVSDVTPKFLLKLRVKDDVTDTVFVMFDRDAEKLVDECCAKLIGDYDMEQHYDMPDEVRALKDQTLLFKIGCGKGSGSRYETSYIVKRVTSNTEIIEKFKEHADSEVTTDNGAENSKVATITAEEVDPQDLSSKFDEAIPADENIGKSQEDVVDLCKDTMDDHDQNQKRKSFPFNGSAPTNLINKHIKIEKM